MSEFLPITLHTPRLSLRHLNEGDTEAYYAIFSDPLVMRYYSSAPWTAMQQSIDAVASVLDAYRSGDALRFAITLADSGELAGTISLHHFFAQNRRCEIGYALASAYWGQGYLGEAMDAVLDHAFTALDMNRIEADIDPRNPASAKALLRAGFQKEGYMPQRWIVNGEICDTEFYGLLRSTWEAR